MIARLRKLFRIAEKPKPVRCSVCRRSLTTRRAIERGMGSVCAKKQNPQKELEASGQERLPIDL